MSGIIYEVVVWGVLGEVGVKEMAIYVTFGGCWNWNIIVAIRKIKGDEIGRVKV